MFLHICLLIASALSTLGVYLASYALSYWWIVPLFVAFYAAWVVIYLLALYISSLFMPTKEPIKKPKAVCRFFIVETMDYVMRLMRAKITVKGREKLPQEPCVIISNHRSCFDPMSKLAVFKERKMAFISKESNMKIPLVGTYIYHAGFFGIDRENGMRALRTLKSAAEIMKSSGIDMGIYPEGTRSKTGELLEFKSGAFLLAKRADAPVVIMATRGTEKIVKRFPFRSTRVELEVLEVIEKEKIKELSMDDLCAYVRGVLEKAL
ncbi:MAG: 1-acyl-sn-glycerol-3-phosphate acyltransferase [Clostridia bacterium]|nr:1-acyl-sn-glycerol-3-phosphate acyltransferase [Clostridia bacterium]